MAALALGVQVAVVGQVVGQRPGLVAGPGLKRGDKLRLVDQADLQRDQAEEKVAISGVRPWHGSDLRETIGPSPLPRGCDLGHRVKWVHHRRSHLEMHLGRQASSGGLACRQGRHQPWSERDQLS